ncbi:MAG: hypothetical protein JWN36_875 [Microbacteriaceae bacterium]|nr:hypothetical protein [Microbacteriaceae bacterium]
MTDVVIDHPNRRFQIWVYTVGMSRLLLRSTKTDEFDTRIDILFQSVKAVSLPTSLRGLRVRIAGAPLRRRVVRNLGKSIADGVEVFSVESLDSVGFVVAGVVFEAEDDKEYFDPSHFRPDL